MSSLPFRQYDAFTLTPLEGNACAIIYDADDLSEPVMQATISARTCSAWRDSPRAE